MRKILTIMLTIVLMFGLFACGNDNTNNNQSNNNQQNNGDGDAGNNNGGQGDNNGGQGNNDGGNSNNNQDTISTKKMASAQLIIAAIGDTFKVSATNPSGEALTTVASDNTYYLVITTFASFSKRIGTYYFPYGDLRDGKYHKMGTPNYYQDDSLGTILARETVGDIFLFADEEIKYQKESQISFLGRNATKYEFESHLAENPNISFSEEIIIDNATGACLKHISQGVATNGYMGSTQKTSFVVTEFEYGANNAAARTILDEYIAKIDVYEWDTAYLTQLGLSNIPALDATFWQSYWDYHSSRDSEEPCWSCEYRLYSDTPEETREIVMNLLHAFYDAGAKDDDGIKAFDELFYDNSEGNLTDLDFVAYIVGNTNYVVRINALFSQYISPKCWKITIDVYFDE